MFGGHLSLIGWMDACTVMETDGCRNQGNPLARLEIVFSGAIGASDNHTLSYRINTLYTGLVFNKVPP